MQKVNFIHPSIFEFKFKRKPKSWTLDQIHDLWIKAKNRAEKRNKEFWEHLAKCYESIPSNDKFERKSIYFYQNDKLRQFDVSYIREFKSYSYSITTSVFKDRDSKLNFWIANDENMKMGQELFNLSKFTSRNFQYSISQILFDLVFQKLRDRYKGEIPPKLVSVKINDKIYIIQSSDSTTYYPKFELVGEYDGNPVSL